MRKPKTRYVVMATMPVVIIILCVYFYFDPAEFPFPKCTFYTLTGWECPGCGIQRAVHALLHGNINIAWHYNPFIFFVIPVLIVLYVAEFLKEKYPRFYLMVNSRFSALCCGLIIVLWWILRNIF